MSVVNLYRPERQPLKFYKGDPLPGDAAGPSPIAVVERASSGRTWERPLNPRFDLADHSPDGFAWGYAGSGPAQTALALLADATGNDALALRHHQRLKEAVIARLARTSALLIDAEVICAMVAEWEIAAGKTMFSELRVYGPNALVGAAPGHLPIVGTDVEVVAYLQGHGLMLLVNRGFCVYRAFLKGLMTATPYEIDTTETFVIRDVNDLGAMR